MARSITIRDVPDEVVDELASRAALSGRSLQEYLRARLTSIAATEDADTWVARVRLRKATTGGAALSVALAESLGADLATLDRKLARNRDAHCTMRTP